MRSFSLFGFFLIGFTFLGVSLPFSSYAAPLCTNLSPADGTTITEGSVVTIAGTTCATNENVSLYIRDGSHPDLIGAFTGTTDATGTILFSFYANDIDLTNMPSPLAGDFPIRVTFEPPAAYDRVLLNYTIVPVAAVPDSCSTFAITPSTIDSGGTVTISASGCPAGATLVLTNSAGFPAETATGTTFNKSYILTNALPSDTTRSFYLSVNGNPAHSGNVTVRAGTIIPTPTPTPTRPGLFSGLVSSVIGVQCPPDTTYISIFDACLDFATTLGWGINWSLIIASLLAMVRFAIGAQQLIFSQGDPGKLQNGRETVTDAMLGLVLLAVAWIVFGYLNETLPSEWQIDLFTVFG